MEPTQQQPFEKKPNALLVPISIIIAGAFVGAGIFLSQGGPSRNFGGSNADAQLNALRNVDTVNIPPVTAQDHILGSPNAKVLIVEYSDTECPFCKVFHQTMHRVIDEYGKDGRVAWVYRHFPIASLHAKAQKEAEATECAAELGGNDTFWKYIDLVYSKTQSSDSLDPAQLPVIAKEVGLNVAKFNECLASGKYAAKINQQVVDAQKSGAEGTPHTILITAKGQKISIKGAQPYDTVKSIIDAALTE